MDRNYDEHYRDKYMPRITRKLIKGSIVAFYLVTSVVSAQDLQSTRYIVLVGDFNSDGKKDVLLQGQDLFVPIGLGDLLVPIIIKPKFDTIVIISFPDGTYAVDSTAQQSAIDQTQWQEGGYQLLNGDFSGNGVDELFLRSVEQGYPSFILSSVDGQPLPIMTQQFLSEIFGLDFGEPGIEVQLADRNNDGRTDILVNRDGMLLSILLAKTGGVFNPVISSDPDDIRETVTAVWLAFCGALDSGNASAAVQYVSLNTQNKYQQVFTDLADILPTLTGNWSNPIPISVSKEYAEYAVTQIYEGQQRLHLIDFVRNEEGRWVIEQM